MPRPTRPPSPVACDCVTVTHAHGTDLMYITHGCGCPPCKAAHTAARRKYRATAYQNGAWIPAGPTAEHIDTLNRVGGYTLRELSELSGVAQGSLRAIRNRRQHQVSTITADAVAGIRPRRAAQGYRDATGARRRLQALTALGWSMRQVADTAGIAPTILHKIRRGAQHRVGPTTYQRVRDAYDALSMTHPPETTREERGVATQARDRAHAEGWMVPLAWDDDRIEDPAHTPAVTPLRPGTTQAQAAARLDELEHLLDGGEPVGDAITRAGYTGLRAALDAAHHAGRTRITRHLTPERTAA